MKKIIKGCDPVNGRPLSIALTKRCRVLVESSRQNLQYTTVFLIFYQRPVSV